MPMSFWSSPVVPGIAAACGLYIIVMMTMMCFIMYSKQRKRAYLYMVAAFLFIMAYEGLNIHFSALSPAADDSDFPEWGRWVRIFAFLLINTSIYLLYRKMHRGGYILLLLMSLLFLVPLSFTWLDQGSIGWLPLYWDVYQLGILLIGTFIIMPRIGQRGKYASGLLVYFAYLIIDIILRYELIPNAWLHTVAALLRLLYYSVIFFILFERIVEVMQSIYRSSITDGLTNLYNRRYFMKQLTRYVDQGFKLSVIFCDIDNFKKLNDTQGHAKADQVLKQVASIIDEEVYGMGLPGRYGGEELVALVVDKRAKVSQIAENIRARVEQETIVTISVGYSVLRKHVTVDELVSQADQAMYQSKTTGKNKVTPYRALSSKKGIQETVS